MVKLATAKAQYDLALQQRSDEIVRLHDAGLSFGDIAPRFKLTRARIAQIYRDAQAARSNGIPSP